MAEAGAAREDDGQPEGSKAKERREEEEQEEQPQVDTSDDLCPVTDKNEKPFRLMDMPPEIRIEIYRACLTRPFDILLSREAKPAEQEKSSVTINGDRDIIELTELQDQHEQGLPAQFPDPAQPDSHGLVAPWAQRGMRALRSMTRQRSAFITNNLNTNTNPSTNPTATSSTSNDATPTPAGNRIRIPTNAHTNNPPRGRRTTSTPPVPTPRAPRPQDVDPLLVNLLRTSKLIYKESRAILYGENNFLLDLDTAQPTLAALHQRSRGQIKHLRVTIPTHNEILERFAEVVRLSLRYCWRLQRFVIHTPFVLPGAEGSSTSGNTTVYANAFDILRWLPRQCEVVLEGNVCEEIRKVVEKNSNLAKSLDEVSHSRFHYDGLVKGQPVKHYFKRT